MKKIIPIILLLIFILCGCTPPTEIDKLMIVSGIGVDISDSDYSVSTQIVNLEDHNENTLSPIIFNTNGSSISSALSKLSGFEGQKLYFTHAQIILISSELLKENGIEHLVKSLNNAPVFLTSISLAVTIPSAEDIINTKPKANPISCYSIVDSIRQSNQKLRCPNIRYYQFLNDVEESGIDGILPVVGTVFVEDDSLPNVGGCALFKDYSLAGMLSAEDTKYLLIAKGEIPNSTYNVDEYSFKINDGKSKISLENGKVIIKVNIEMSLLEGGQKDIKELEKIVQDDCIQGIEKILKYTQELECDPIGIWRYIKRNYSSAWKYKYSDNWRELYRDLPVEAKVTVSIASSPKLTGSKR